MVSCATVADGLRPAYCDRPGGLTNSPQVGQPAPHSELLLAAVHFYPTGASTRRPMSGIDKVEALKRYEAVMVASNWRLFPGCAVIRPRVGLCTSATRNSQLHRGTSGHRRPSPHRSIRRLSQAGGGTIFVDGKWPGGDPADARHFPESRRSQLCADGFAGTGRYSRDL